jgi:hypothetical protein
MIGIAIRMLDGGHTTYNGGVAFCSNLNLLTPPALRKNSFCLNDIKLCSSHTDDNK